MRRTLPTLILAFSMLPACAQSIQLRWSNGSTDLSFTAATRCTLVVQANPALALPSEWRLLWVLDAPQSNPFQIDRSDSSTSFASVCRIEDAPSSFSDNLEHLQPASFCTNGGPRSGARYIINFPAGTAGRIGIVQLHGAPLGIASEVTLNHGVRTPYPPLIAQASEIAMNGENVLQLRGGALDSVSEATFQARSELAPHPLPIMLQTDSMIVLHTGVADSLPPGYIQLSNRLGAKALWAVTGPYAQ